MIYSLRSIIIVLLTILSSVVAQGQSLCSLFDTGVNQNCVGDLEISWTDQTFCVGQPVGIIPNILSTAENLIIDWGDGTPCQVIPAASVPDTVWHNYADPDTCISPASNIFLLVDVGITTICNSNEVLSSYAIVPFTILFPPLPNFVLPDEICTNEVIPYSPPCTNSNSYTIEWNPPYLSDVLNPFSPNPFSNGPTGSVTVSMTLENTCGIVTQSHTLCVIDPPDPTFSAPPSLCIPGSLQVSNTSELSACHPSNWQWILRHIGPIPGCGGTLQENDTLFASHGSFNITEHGEYRLTLYEWNDCGLDSSFQIIHAETLPSISVFQVPDTCLFYQTYPHIQNTVCSGSTDSMTELEHVWSFSEASPPSTYTGSTPPPISYNSDGIHSYTVSTTGNCGTTTVTDQFQIFSEATSIPPNDTVVCASFDTIQLPGNSASNWTSNQPCCLYFTSSTWGFIPSEPGTHQLNYIVGSGDCSDTSLMTVVVEAPEVWVSPTSANICEGESVLLVAGGAADSFSWNPVSLIIPVSGDTVSVTPSQTTTFTVIGTTQSNGCIDSAMVTVMVHTAPVIDAGPDEHFCYQDIWIDLPEITAGTWSGNGVGTSPSFNPYTAGLGIDTLVYSFTDANGCSASDTMIATIIGAQVANAGNDTTVCQSSGILQLAGFPTSGSWTGYGNINPIDPLGNYDPISNGSDILVYSIGTGTCVSTDTVTITVLGLPNIPTIPNTGFCNTDGPVTLMGNPNNAVWSGTGVINPQTGLFDPNIAGAGIHTISYQLTTTQQASCSNSVEFEVTVDSLSAGFVTDSVACIGASVEFMNTSEHVSTAVSFQWDFGDPNSPTGSSDVSPMHSFTATGLYPVTLVATTTWGCSDNYGQSISVISPPVADFVLDPISGCGPLEINITNTSQGDSIACDWNLGNGSMLTNMYTPPVSAYNTGLGNDTIYIIELSVANLCGSDSRLDSVVVYSPPIAIVGTTVSTICSGDTIGLINSSLGFSNTYSWDLGNGISGTSSDPLPTEHWYTNQGQQDTVYTISLTATNPCGTDIAFAPIIVHPNQVTAFFNTSPPSGCSNLSVQFTNYSTPNCVYFWDFGDGNYSNSYNPQHTFHTALGSTDSTFQVSLIVHGCGSDTASGLVTVFSQPDLSITVLDSVVCFGDSITLAYQSPQQLSNLWWFFADGDSSNLSSPSHLYGLAGIYEVLLVGTSSINGCSDTVSQRVVISETPHISISPIDTFGCQPFSLSFANNTMNVVGNSWYFGDLGQNTSYLNSPTHVYSVPGEFVGRYIASDGYGVCMDSVYFHVKVHPKPTSEFFFDQIAICQMPDTLRCTNISSGESLGFAWDFGNGTTSTLNNPEVVYTVGGDYLISLIASTPFGCSDTSYVSHSNVDVPHAEFTFTSADPCRPIFDFINLSSSGDTFLWDFGLGEISTESNPTHLFSTYGESTVTLVINPDGVCTDSISRIVNHDNGSPARIFIPNSFTPNKDGLNDSFVLKGYNDCGVYVLTIYDRWGKILYTTNNLDEFWDGTYHGKDVKSGTYVYVLQSLTSRKTGKVNIVRN